MSMIYIYSTNEQSPGINKIIMHLTTALNSKGVNSKVIYSIENISKNSIVIPYGIKAAYILFQNGFILGYCLMVDAYTLGWFKKVFFYIKKMKLFYYDLYYSIYQIFRYSYKEYLIIRKFKKIMYVSPYDLDKIKFIFKKKEFILVPNGVDLCENVIIRDHLLERCLTLGTISNWDRTSLDEIKWFIEDYYPKLKIKFPNLKMKIAGMEKDSYVKSYFDSVEGINFIGKVDSLSAFFSQIDIFLGSVPKGVGILNKVLDAFAYKVLVAGLPECFFAFPGNVDGFLVCENLNDFENAFNLYLNDKDKVRQMIEQSYSYVKKNNNWSSNYNYLADDIVNFYDPLVSES
jgi:hypothetical protein